MCKLKFVSVFALVALLLGVVVGPVVAQEPPPDEPSPDAAEDWPEDFPLGPPPGYRVDTPSSGAVVHREAVQPLGGQLLASGTLYRSGWTNGWYEYLFPDEIWHVGEHNSGSDLDEDEIKVDGFMKITGSWVDHCPCHTSGTFAHCNTEKRYLTPHGFYVESHHSFRKEGYGYDYFETGKSIGI